MSSLVFGIRHTVERDDRIRTALLAAFTVALALTFMVLLISDQAKAAVL